MTDLYGSSGGDTIFGGAFDDSIYSFAGNDRIYGQAGDDYINGGSRNDEYRFYADDTGENTIMDKDGANKIFFASTDSSYSSSSFTFAKSTDGDDLIITAIGTDTTYGTAYTQQVTVEDYYDSSDSSTFSIHYNTADGARFALLTSGIPE